MRWVQHQVNKSEGHARSDPLTTNSIKHIKDTTIMGPAQDLQQKVCQKYGWSFQYSTNDNGQHQVEVVVGFGDKRTFVAPITTTTKTPQDDKAAKASISALALQGLAPIIEVEESKPVGELAEAFASLSQNPTTASSKSDGGSNITVLNSSHEDTWKTFWNERPSVVGIDVEGNQISPPVLVQIATESYTILEVPDYRQRRLSPDLQRLLNDDSIIKVFCDNFAHKDKTSLGLSLPPAVTEEGKFNFAEPPIVDLESVAMKLLGPVKVARGLPRLVNLAMPELGIRIVKPKPQKGRFKKIGKFALIEQGKLPPLKGLNDLSKEEQQYAALDAWFTLNIYRRLLKLELESDRIDA